MPHQCVRCSAIYEDGNRTLLMGCERCGGKFFFYLKKEAIKDVEVFTNKLSTEDKYNIEQDVRDILGAESEKHPIVLNLETIKVLQPGKFELDLADLFSKKPLIIKLEEGKYYIDVPSTFAAKDLGIKDSAGKEDVLDRLGDADSKNEDEES